jgi:hypothetical protein
MRLVSKRDATKVLWGMPLVLTPSRIHRLQGSYRDNPPKTRGVKKSGESTQNHPVFISLQPVVRQQIDTRPLVAEHLDMDGPLPRAIELRKHQALELAEDRLAIDDGQKDALPKDQGTQMGCSVLTVAV